MMNLRGFRVCALLGILLIGRVPLKGEHRSFDLLFPRLDEAAKRQVFSPEGCVVSTRTAAGLTLLAASALDPAISGSVLNQDPAYLTESLLVIPTAKPVSFIRIYNAMGNIQDLKGRLYYSDSRHEDIPLFEDATRIASSKKLSPIPDPPQAASVPASETMYIRLKDVNFGNSYYRADITVNGWGLVYTLSNFKSLTYLFIPVIKENKFIAQLYFEPIAEGVLVYSLAGTDVSDFIASKIDIPSAIRKRLDVIVQWMTDGITAAP
ncbi:MAG: hypothetical protein LBP88_04495 [Treponema sp.]|jgi:hypothetical protein|nr:hypothetical protein [Treponema sp.]